MLVELKYNWFCTSELARLSDGRVMSGSLLHRGVHELPDELYDRLPKGTKILQAPKKPDKEVPQEPKTRVKKVHLVPGKEREKARQEKLAQYDEERAGSDVSGELQKAAKGG